jgi:hypothetical protein
LDRVGRVVHLDGQVEVFEDAREQRQRTGQRDADAEQPHQRPEQPGLKRGEGDKGTDAQRAGGERQAGAEVDDRRDGGEDDAHRGHPPAAGEFGAQLQVDEAGGRGGEALDQCGAGAHGLAELYAADRQALLDDDVEVGEFALARSGDLPAHPGHLAGQVDRRGQHDQRDQGEPPGQRGHRDGGGDRGGQVRGYRGGGRGDHRLHAADVVGDAGLHLAGAGAGEEGDGLPVQVGEDVCAQPVHHLLADLGGDPGLHDAEGRGHGGHGHHAEDQPDQQGQVTPGQGPVDDGAQQERRGHRDDRGGHDDRDHRGELAAVGREELADAAE